ncbi:aromatic amino acid transport family protein [Chlamydia sp.]|uniref:aromatic amino acid transport family protein n=1 Tax=Chlamydia sp. TaxID=35827 RepID=UPI0025BA81B6|nr:aromatic amino acid transport family protein [Chlamydia sp.]MBQ8498535.1 amino acid transporter [Chlamydia sp.]
MDMRNKCIGGILIVAGTVIGAGVLAVPVLTAMDGFFPAALLYVLGWLVSLASGYGYLEVLTWCKGNKLTNLYSMAEETLGRVGRIVLCLVYLFLFYSLLVAYFCDGGNILSRIIGEKFIETSWMRHVMPVLFFVIFAPLLMTKTSVIDYCNRGFVFGLIFVFGLFCVLGAPRIQGELLLRTSWFSALNSLPIFFLAFGFQNVVPSLYHYLDGNVREVKRVILIGSLIPLILYIIWEALVLGTVPLADLLRAKQLGWTAAGALQGSLKNSAFYIAGELFGFFALVTSFIGTSLALKDFYIDIFKWDAQKQRMHIFFLVFVFPLIWAVVYPEIVLSCLRYAGGVGGACIVVLFPVIMLWNGRYGKRHCSGKRILPGGKTVLLILTGYTVLNLVTLYYTF